MNNELYRSIRVLGRDAEHFLQGQLTQDVNRLSETPSLPAAWCNPKGRVITTVRLLRQDEAVDIALPATGLDAVIQRLSMYRLRAKVELAAQGPEWLACAISDAGNRKVLDGLRLLPADLQNDCRSERRVVAVSLGDSGVVEVFAHREHLEAIGLDLDAALEAEKWRRARIEAGLPDIGAGNSEKFTPHMLNLDAIGAVSFDKGCYTGQEVVARTENLGRSKRRLMQYELAEGTVAIGDPVSDGERDVGTVVNVSGDRLLAVTPVALHAHELSVHGHSISPGGLPYPLD